MRRRFAGLGLLGLMLLGACSYTVEVPPEHEERGSPSAASPAATVSPAVTLPPGHPPMEGSGTARMGGTMPPMTSPHGEAAPLSHTIPIGDKLELEAPDDWVPKRPSVGIIQNEFAVPPAEGDEEDGRVTVMIAGGTIDANIERWFGQFKQPDGSATSESAKVEKLEVAGREVRLVDISGTYSDQRGPFAPPVEQPGYRMLAAIITTAEGNYFVKFYGPSETVAAQAGAFREMIKGLSEDSS